MDDQLCVYATGGTIIALIAVQGLRGRLDPFAPVWLFLVGFVQVYVVQAISYREWALHVRGVELVTTANARAFWALLWFLLAYHCGLGRMLATRLPQPPVGWSPMAVGLASPLLIAWGLLCAG